MNSKKVMLAMMAIMALEVQAEEALTDTSRVFDIDEVVVVSQPKEVFRLRQQALSSSSVGSNVIQRLGTRDLRELSLYVPNFVMPNYGSRLSSALYVRGIGSRVNSPAIGIYIDGIPVMSKATFNLHNYQLSRVDVLRGPQGTLYGQNTEGGLVRLFSRDPFLYSGTDVKMGYGSRHYHSVEAAHYQSFGNSVALSVAGFYEGQKGFFRNVTTGERADKYDEAGGKMMLKCLLGNRWTLDVMADYQYVDQMGFPYGKLQLSTGQTEMPASTFAGTYRRNMLLSGVRIGYKGTGYEFSSVSSYQYVADGMFMDQDYLPQDYMAIRQRQVQNSLTQELTFRSNQPIGGFWHWAAGTFFSSQWLRTNAPVFFNSALTTPIAEAIKQQMVQAMPPSMASGLEMEVDMGAPGLYHTPQVNMGLFQESHFDITNRLTATLGLRYDYMLTKVSYQSAAYMTMTATVMGQNATYTLSSLLDGNDHDHYNQLLPKVGLTYKLDKKGSNAYVIMSKGYRAGGYNIQMFSDILQAELNANRQNAMHGSYDIPHTAEDYQNVNATISYKPEITWNYETGVHLNLFDHVLHLDLSAFYMQVHDQQLSVMAGNYGFGRMMVNAGRSHSCGIEAGLRGQMFGGNFDWMLNYGFTHAVFDEYVDGEVSYEDKSVPYVPQHTLSAMADYTIHFASCNLRSLTFGTNVTGQGQIYWDNANSYSQPFYAVLGAHVDADFGMLQLSLWGRNLTNAHYNTFAVDNAATGQTEYFAQRGNPFQCGVEMRLHF